MTEHELLEEILEVLRRIEQHIIPQPITPPIDHYYPIPAYCPPEYPPARYELSH